MDMIYVKDVAEILVQALINKNTQYDKNEASSETKQL